MKSVIFLADGMADEPLKELDGKTPLEYAATPAMDEIAKHGASGTFLTLPEGLPTSSDVANMSVLGFFPEKNYPGRGPIEAVSQNINLQDGDVAWRCNLVYVSSDGVLRDYSAGHIDNATAAKLMQDLQREFGNEKLTFHSGVSYRNLLILHGKEFSDQISYHKPDSSQDIAVSELRLQAKIPAAQHTVDFLEDLGRRAGEFLRRHPLNHGKEVFASDIWPWSPGKKPALADFSTMYHGKKGAIISAVDVIKGIGKCSKMTVAEVPGATGYLDTNYDGKANAAINALKTHDFVYIHVEAIDECSHEGNLQKKLQAITDFDAKIVKPVMAALRGEEVCFAVLPDHPVPLKKRVHTTVPVPFAVCGPQIKPDAVEIYSEKTAKNGSMGFLHGDELMKLVLNIK